MPVLLATLPDGTAAGAGAVVEAIVDAFFAVRTVSMCTDQNDKIDIFWNEKSGGDLFRD